MRLALVVPGGLPPPESEETIPALVSLVSRLSKRHQVYVVVVEHQTQRCQYHRWGAWFLDLGKSRWPLGLKLVRRVQDAVTYLRPHRPELVHGFWLGGVGALAALTARSLRIPYIASLGGGELVRFPELGYGGALKRRGRWLNQFAIRSAARLTAGSRTAAQDLDAIWLPLGAEPRFHGPLERAPGARLITVSNLNRIKNPELMLQTFVRVRASIPEATLDWVGEDTLNGRIQADAAKVPGIRFCGQQNPAQIRDLLQKAHLYVQTSWHESQGVAVLEAALAGVPVVGTPVGILPEIAPTAEGPALARLVVDLLQNPKQRLALATRVQKFAAEHDADWTAARFEALYATINRN